MFTSRHFGMYMIGVSMYADKDADDFEASLAFERTMLDEILAQIATSGLDDWGRDMCLMYGFDMYPFEILNI